MTQINLLRQVKNLNFPEGFLINGQIVTSVSSGNLTVAIKTLTGTDPSATDPVYCRIGGVVRTITGPLSVTINAGGNRFNTGSSELTTKEVDYFTYLCYSSTNNNVQIAFSRIPYGNTQAVFSSEGSNEKFITSDWLATFISTDPLVNIGRFNAILGAGNTWSIPATSLIINRPIYYTRFLDYSPQGTGYTAGGAKYKIDNESLYLIIDSTANITGNITTPFTCTNTVDNQMNTDTGTAILPKNSNTITVATNPQNITGFYGI